MKKHFTQDKESGLSTAQEPVKKRERTVNQPEEHPLKERDTRLNPFGAFIMLVLCCWTLICLSSHLEGLLLHPQREYDTTVQFDQDGMAYIDFSSGYSLGRTYSAIVLEYVSHSPEETPGRVTVGFELQHSKKGPYTPYPSFDGNGPGEYSVVLDHNTQRYIAIFHLPEQYSGAAKNCRFVIQSTAGPLEEATFHIDSWL